MILTVDIGNTTTSLALLNKKKVQKLWSIQTTLSKKEFGKQVNNILGSFKTKGLSIGEVLVCSVAPKALSVINPIIRRQLRIKPVIIGVDRKVPIKNRYHHPTQVGQDRLVGAYAACQLYGAPVIIIDLGTAITFDLVSTQKEYLGGVIVPGIQLSLESLFHKTAMLPKPKVTIPRSLIGKDTETSILSGIFYGYGSLCSGLIDLISKKVRKRPKVIMTGGHMHLMKKFIPQKINVMDPHLVHKGMGLLSRK